ncbi:MAG: hypothetical protein MUD08_18280 [Cytophagales bacterium]|nr:hypothetical protein [Cytophagales bacterium]
MLPIVRKQYNEAFTEAKYQSFLDDLNTSFGYRIPFRVAETPVFVSADLRDALQRAGDEIVDVLVRPDFKQLTAAAVPNGLHVPNEDDHTLFLALDFAVCRDENGAFLPQLIELQGFPSLYGFEDWVAHKYRTHFPVPENMTHLFGGYDSVRYRERLRQALLNGHPAENVILLEIEPMKQNTAIDFLVTEQYTGIKPVCLSEIIREGRNLFYMNNGVKTPVRRIYNRIIFDELLRRDDLTRSFNLTEDVDVEWAGHPNWFFRISKYTMPFLKSRYVPDCRFLSDYEVFPTDLENYVLKPLFSFSGQGVKYHVTTSDLGEILVAERKDYLLQRKVNYEPVLQAPDGKVKVEIRLLFLWEKDRPRPELLLNLARLSRGEMIGVKYNKDKTWVGGTVCFFEP